MRRIVAAACVLYCATGWAQIAGDASLGTVVSRSGNAWSITAGTPVGGTNLFHSFSQFGVPRNNSATFSGLGNVQNIIGRVTGPDASFIDGLLRSTIPGASLWLINPKGVAFGAHSSIEVPGSLHISTANYLRLGSGPGILQASLSATSTLSSAAPSAFGFLGPTVAPISVTRANLFPFPNSSLSLVGGNLTLDHALIQAQGVDVVLAATGSAREFNLASRQWSGPAAAAASVTLKNGTKILTSSLTTGIGAGEIAIRSDDVFLLGANLESDTITNVAGRGVSIQATRDFTMRDGIIFSGAFVGTAPAGSVSISAPNITFTDNATINTDSDSRGNAGSIVLHGRNIVVAGSQFAARSLSTGANAGSGGNILLEAEDRITLQDNASFSTDTKGAGAGGGITLRAPEVMLLTSANIRSNSEANGPGGNITIEAGPRFMLAGGAVISTDTLGPARGGEVQIFAGGEFEIRGGHIFSGTQAAASGDAGAVTVSAASIAISGAEAISTKTFGSANAGNITIAAGPIDIAGGTIESSTSGAGRGGEILVSASRLAVRGRGHISASSSGLGQAGDIAINAAESLRLLSGGSITTEARSSDGGNVTIRAGQLVYLKDSRITTSVNESTGSGGNILIDPVFVILDHSQIIARAAKGRGGNIDIVSDFFFSFASEVDASSREGISGSVQISSPNLGAKPGQLVLAGAYLDASGLLRESCAARAARAQTNSFVAAGRGGLPMADLVFGVAGAAPSPALPQRELRSLLCPSPSG